MTEIVGIRFRNAGKIYYFSTAGFQLEPPMHVIVETARGIEMGTVLLGNREVEDDKVVQPLKPVIRIATEEDDIIVEKNKEKEKEAFKICKEKIAKHGLEMKLVDAEYTFDNNKLLFYFTADGRIDFRELVKDLAAVFRTRIELRQIGVRDEAKIMGGVGICGRELCCKTFLFDFAPVSIKMAKEQNLSLNPAKISGVCGRLMCCLKNEQETYEHLNSMLPNVGDTVKTVDGLTGEVTGMSVLRQQIKVLVDTGDVKELREYHVKELEFKPRKKKDVKVTAEELKEVAELEELEKTEQAELSEKPKNNKPKQKKKPNNNNGNSNNNNNNNSNNNNNNSNNSNNNGNKNFNRNNKPNNNGPKEKDENRKSNDFKDNGSQQNKFNGGSNNGGYSNSWNKNRNKSKGNRYNKNGSQQNSRRNSEGYNENRNDNRKTNGNHGKYHDFHGKNKKNYRGNKRED